MWKSAWRLAPKKPFQASCRSARIPSLNASGAGGRAASKIIEGAGERKVEVANSNNVQEGIVQVAGGCAVKRRGKRREEPR